MPVCAAYVKLWQLHGKATEIAVRPLVVICAGGQFALVFFWRLAVLLFNGRRRRRRSGGGGG